MNKTNKKSHNLKKKITYFEKEKSMRSEPQDMAAFKWEHLWYYAQVGMCRMKIKKRIQW